jgi:hypothetical protein
MTNGLDFPYFREKNERMGHEAIVEWHLGRKTIEVA